MPAPPRILCIAPSWLGDAVLALPALELLTRAGASVEVLARRGTERLFADAVAAANLHTTSASSRTRRLRDAWALRHGERDGVLVLPPSFAAALLAAATRAPVRIGAATQHRAALLTHSVPPPSRDVHLSQAYADLARRILAALAMSQPQPEAERAALAWPRLRVQAAEQAAAAKLLAAHGVTGPTLVVAPGARYGAAKRYPPERFAAAAASLAACLPARVVLVGASADSQATAAVAAQCPGAVDLAGHTTLAELLGLLADAAGVLSNDSGVMHLAAALGTAVVGVFGSTNPRWTGPLGERARSLSHPVPCAPCYRRRCPIDFPCMLGIEPDALVMALLELLAAPAAPMPSRL